MPRVLIIAALWISMLWTQTGRASYTDILVTVTQIDGTSQVGRLKYIEPAKARGIRAKERPEVPDQKEFGLRTQIMGLEGFVIWPVAGFVSGINFVMALTGETNFSHFTWSVSALYLTGRGWQSMLKNLEGLGDFILVDEEGRPLTSIFHLSAKQVIFLNDMVVRKKQGWLFNGERVIPRSVEIFPDQAGSPNIHVQIERMPGPFSDSGEDDRSSDSIIFADQNLKRGSTCQKYLLGVLHGALIEHVFLTFFGGGL